MMARISADLFADNYLGKYRSFMTLIDRRVEAAALIATDRAAQIAKRTIRDQMKAAQLGKLANAIDATSDMQKNGKVHRMGGKDFSASGVIFVRSQSERTLGALEAYTLGADIKPVRSRWLWIATDQIPRVTQRKRMTPQLYKQNGFEQKIGPLVFVKSINGYPLLVVKTATVSAVGKARSARAHLKNGRPGKGQRSKEFIVAFIGIPRTSRQARIDIKAILRSVQAQLPRLFSEAMERTF